MQASNFGGTFDQLFLEFFYEIFTEDASLHLLYHGAKSQKWPKTQIKGGPALNVLLGRSEFHQNESLSSWGSSHWAKHWSSIFLSTNPVHQSRQCLIINSPPDLSFNVQWWALTKRQASYGGQFTFEACNRENFLGTPPGLLPARKRWSLSLPP